MCRPPPSPVPSCRTPPPTRPAEALHQAGLQGAVHLTPDPRRRADGGWRLALLSWGRVNVSGFWFPPLTADLKYRLTKIKEIMEQAPGATGPGGINGNGIDDTWPRYCCRPQGPKAKTRVSGGKQGRAPGRSRGALDSEGFKKHLTTPGGGLSPRRPGQRAAGLPREAAHGGAPRGGGGGCGWVENGSRVNLVGPRNTTACDPPSGSTMHGHRS